MTTAKTKAVGTKCNPPVCATARAVGVDKSYISRIFSGERTPSLATSARIAKQLGLTLDQFYLELSAKN